jgi:GNAT superfamily N-acetyltransferase
MHVRGFDLADLDAVVRLWNETKRDTYHFIPIERARTVEEDRAFFRERILPHCAIWVAEEDRAIRGFSALNGTCVDRLYVHPSAQRRGVGTALLAQLQHVASGGFELYTHQKNTKARRFYEKHGLIAVRFGVSPPPESEPDVEYHWRPAR